MQFDEVAPALRAVRVVRVEAEVHGLLGLVEHRDVHQGAPSVHDLELVDSARQHALEVLAIELGRCLEVHVAVSGHAPIAAHLNGHEHGLVGRRDVAALDHGQYEDDTVEVGREVELQLVAFLHVIE